MKKLPVGQGALSSRDLFTAKFLAIKVDERLRVVSGMRDNINVVEIANDVLAELVRAVDKIGCGCFDGGPCYRVESFHDSSCRGL